MADGIAPGGAAWRRWAIAGRSIATGVSDPSHRDM